MELEVPENLTQMDQKLETKFDWWTVENLVSASLILERSRWFSRPVLDVQCLE